MTRFPSHDPGRDADHPDFDPDPDPDPGSGSDPDFDKELLAAMTAFADNTPAPVIDALAIRRTVRRRTVLSGAVAAAAVVAIGTGAALLAPGSGPSPSGGLPAAPRTPRRRRRPAHPPPARPPTRPRPGPRWPSAPPRRRRCSRPTGCR